MINHHSSFLFLTIAVILSFAIGDSIISTSIHHNSSLCDDFFNNLTNKDYHGPNMSIEINNLLLYSGHNLADLGYYKACRSLPTQRYSLLSISGIGVGFCGPSFCSVNQLQGYTDTIIQIISNITQRNINLNTITFTDPDQTGITQGFWFYFTGLLYTILIGLVISGTVLAWQKRRKAKLQYSFVSSDPMLKDPLAHQKDNASAFINSGIFKSHIESRSIKAPTPSFNAPLYIKIIQCFDIIENVEALFKDEKIPGHDKNLNVTAGIRTLAFFWVVYGHTFVQATASKNFLFGRIFEKSGWYLITAAALYAVETFFYLSGFFTGFLMINKLKKMPLGLKSYGLVLFHRWVRLWPAYFVAILFYWKISVYLGSGPLWPAYVSTANYCDDSAWKNFLLLDNVLTGNFDYYCFSWGWYLACDFQMFLLAPFICWIYIKDRKRSQNILALLMTLGLCSSYSYSSDTGYTFTMNPGSNSGNDYMVKYYINTLTKLPPYVVGLWLGFKFKEYKDGEINFFTALKKSNKYSIICSFFGLAILLALTFVPRVLQTGATWSDGFAMTWSTFSRPAWVFGVFFITAPCLVGNLKGLSGFLGNYYFVLIARLSYTGYLIHLVFLQMIYAGIDQYYGGSQLYQSCLAMAICLLGCAGGAVLHLFVEKPITNIEAHILSSKKRSR